jgi:hypothetical protein
LAFGFSAVIILITSNIGNLYNWKNDGFGIIPPTVSLYYGFYGMLFDYSYRVKEKNLDEGV